MRRVLRAGALSAGALSGWVRRGWVPLVRAHGRGVAPRPCAARAAHGSRPDRGAVTAELAVGTVAVVVVMAGALSVGQAVTAQLRCTDAAAAGARAAARGAPAGEVTALATALAGSGAQASVRLGGELADVVVTAPVDLVLPGAPDLVVTGRAASAVEVTAATARGRSGEVAAGAAPSGGPV